MGTNYYLCKKGEKLICPHCLEDVNRRHIGKSSAGWVFALHVYPAEGIHDLRDWEKLWRDEAYQIEDEYGKVITHNKMLENITERSNLPWDQQTWLPYANERNFHRSNHSLRGPNGLLRSQLSERCIKHGAGTWDCFVGHFL